MARITFVCQCLTGLEIIEECSFINIKYVLRLVSIYFGQLFAFSVHHSFGIYNGTFSQHSLNTTLCHFLKQSIHLFEARQQSIVRWAATCRALSLRWGPSMDALAIWACLNHAERMISSSSIGKVFRDLRSVMTHIASVVSQFQTIYSLSCWMLIPANQAFLLHTPEFPREHQLRLKFIIPSVENTLCCFFILTINGKYLALLTMIIEH